MAKADLSGYQRGQDQYHRGQEERTFTFCELLDTLAPTDFQHKVFFEAWSATSKTLQCQSSWIGSQRGVFQFNLSDNENPDNPGSTAPLDDYVEEASDDDNPTA